MANNNVKQQIVDKIKDSNNILVTVSSNPSVDELSAALGITLLLNKLNKHATAIFSGAIPLAIEFLQPEKTFENTVDSLRDFIIALDKEKADHLRYKVVDDMVKIFITPYRTTISEKDLDFSQGDYNVETVLAVGVKAEADLDRALESHGRILHDATVAAISLGEATNLGGLEWVDKDASSYSEMLVELAAGLKTDKDLFDEQIATAFLTGIVAATERFSNNRTSSRVMTTAAQLMAAGANQQLIATKLEEGSELASSISSDEASLPIDEAEQGEMAPEIPAAASESDAAAGSLAISHVPEGDVAQVTKVVAEQKADEALDEAEAELAQHTQMTANDVPLGTTTLAKTKLAEGPAAAPSAYPVEAPLRGPVAMDQWNAPGIQQYEPSMGGTLNATTEQAAVDMQREIDNDRNRTILTHEGSGYASGQPIFQSSINAASQSFNDEPVVLDILAGAPGTMATEHAAAIQPPAPLVTAPTLAEIDLKNRVSQADAMAAVTTALGVPHPDPAATGAGDLPPASTPSPLPVLPPMPDFSTLPPLPGNTSAGPLVSSDAPLGDALPPIVPTGFGSGAPETAPIDPAQFRIPGQ